MKLSPPKQITFYIAVIVWIIALIGLGIAALQPDCAQGAALIAKMGYAYWLALLAGLILAIGNLWDGI